MRNYKYILFTFFIVIKLNAQEFYGGSSDGNATATIEDIQSVYNGGIADGFSSDVLEDNATIFAGGSSDGFSNSFYNESFSTFIGGNADGFYSLILEDGSTIFAGGFSDGFSNSLYNESFSTFIGGNADGFSSLILEDSSTIFAGGFSDGFSMTTIYDLLLNPKAYFQGAYINPVSGEETLMRDNLRVASLIPTTSPYLDVLTCDASVFTVTGNDAIVDWVWVELRDKNDVTNIITSQSALLQRDGDIVAVDGISPMSFNIADDNYFVVVSHRNHLGVVSANAVALSSTTTIVDLSSNANSVDGGANAVVDLGNGIFALYAGDYDGNGQVQNTDLTSIRPLLGQPSGYSDADLDMNTQVQNTDINNLLNPNKGRGQQFARSQNLKLYAKRKK